MKYTKVQIREAKAMRGKGYDFPAIAKFLGFKNVWSVRYHIVPGEKKKVLLNSRKWQRDNRKRFLATMRVYSKHRWALLKAKKNNGK